LFTLPETLVVYNLPLQASEYKHNEQTYVVYSTEYDKLIQHMKRSEK
jgi:hypothetical protein